MRYLEIDESKIILDKVVDYKDTARFTNKYFCHNESIGDKKYIVECADTEVSKYYFARSRMGEQIFQGLFRNNDNIVINSPIECRSLENEEYAIFEMKEGKQDIRWIPDALLTEYYKNSATSHEVTDELVDQILAEFLFGWPCFAWENIKKIEEYVVFRQELKKYSQIQLVVEHGDFTPNNILCSDDGTIYLLDFEFTKKLQPIGFDLFDWHYATDKRYDNIPYKELNQLKEVLINKINALVDQLTIPYIECVNNEFIKNNIFIYNKYEQIYGNDFQLYRVDYDERSFFVPMHVNKNNAEIGIWMQKIPSRAFNYLIKIIMKKNRNIHCLNIKYSMQPYNNSLSLTNHVRIDFKDCLVPITLNLKKKAKGNLERSRKKLVQEIGELEIAEYLQEEIPEEIVNLYFKWKKKSHGTDYNISPKKYINDYHISHAYTLQNGDNMVISIIFTCEQGEIVYLENLSFDSDYAKYSPGWILYVGVLQELICKGKRGIYLGDGQQQYKYHFNSINELAFSGLIYRNNFYRWFDKVKVLF